MPIPSEALELENQNVGMNGKPTLGAAFRLMWAEWEKGVRDRELCLHLLFLCWFGLGEPEHLTGFREDERDSLTEKFGEAYEYVQPEIENDVEMLYTVGLGGHLFGYLLPGGERVWDARSEEYRRRYRELSPAGLDPAIFSNRGAYGDYYHGQASAERGY